MNTNGEITRFSGTWTHARAERNGNGIHGASTGEFSNEQMQMWMVSI